MDNIAVVTGAWVAVCVWILLKFAEVLFVGVFNRRGVLVGVPSIACYRLLGIGRKYLINYTVTSRGVARIFRVGGEGGIKKIVEN